MAVKNRKLCWNCEGSVHVRATKCPFCGSELSAEAAEKPKVASPYAAPVPQPPYSPTASAASVVPEAPPEEPKAEAKPQQEGVVLPLLLLLPGVFFLLFGILLALFATDGILTLKWNARYWFIYCTLACPLLWFGWKSLRQE